MKNKKVIFLVCFALILLTAVPTFAGRAIKVLVNGKESMMSTMLVNGSTFAPLRAIAEGLEADVTYQNGKVYINTKEKQVKNGVKITTLAENSNHEHSDLVNEFGLGMYIETDDCKVIFDTGKFGGFVDNAQKLGIDLSKANFMVLSHAHYDHTGGVKTFFEKFDPENTTLVVKNGFFDYWDSKYFYDAVGQKFDFSDGTPGYFPVGIDFNQDYLKEKGITVEYIDSDRIRIGKNVTVYGNFQESSKEKFTPSMVVKSGNEYQIDDFVEEVAVAIETDKGLVIATGCSHTGILNIVETIKNRSGKNVYAVIGGLHLLNADEAKIQSTINEFKKLGVEKIGVSHCTGQKATEMFKKELPGQVFVNSTGTVFEVK